MRHRQLFPSSFAKSLQTKTSRQCALALPLSYATLTICQLSQSPSLVSLLTNSLTYSLTDSLTILYSFYLAVLYYICQNPQNNYRFNLINTKKMPTAFTIGIFGQTRLIYRKLLSDKSTLSKTKSISLSPRPDRLTKILSSADMVLAIFIA